MAHHAVGLDRKLGEVALEHAGRAADRLHREDARQERADDAADAVDAEHVEAVVVAKKPLQSGGGDVAADAGSRADDEGTLGIDEAAKPA